MVRVHVVTSVSVESERDICQRFAARIYAYGVRHLRDAAAAQDLVQQVLLSVLVALREGRVDDRSRLEQYVFGACRNASKEMRRGDARRERLAHAAGAGLPEGYEPEWPRVDPMRLEGCLRGLDARDRAVVLATFVEDRDADEIASAMKLTPGNVRVIRHRAIARLHSCVEGT